MTKAFKNILTGTAFALAGAVFFQLSASYNSEQEFQQPDDEMIADSTPQATGPQFKLKPDPTFPQGDLKAAEGIQLQQPSNIRSDVEYDANTGEYIFTNKMGEVEYRRPTRMSKEEFHDYELKRTVREYWVEQANGGKSSSQRGFKPSFSIGSEAMDKIFGGSTINIVPQGQAELIFGIDINTTENPAIQENMRTTTSFNFEEKINMNITGTIGDRLRLGINYNTEATFEFENKTKLDYTGEEDDIIKKVEAGDVTLPLPGTLITGSQSLFGIKTEMQFGKLNVTTVLSQQRGQTQEVQVQGGAQVNEFEITADEYEANKHFFLAHSFKESYDDAHKFLPRISSGVTITKIEVWVTNRKGSFQDARNVVAFVDLAESDPNNMVNQSLTYRRSEYADNSNNELYARVAPRVHNGDTMAFNISEREYQSLQSARPLSQNEYTFNRTLGYISLNSALNADEILAVAYEYQVNGKTFKVGELSSEDPDKKPLVVKLIKGANLSPRMKTWELMMKNIYSLGAYELSNEDFYLDVMYRDDANGADVNYIPHGPLVKTPLIKLLNLDKVNSQLQEFPDGVYDFIDGITIDKRYGRIIFPMRQPFGKNLYDSLKNWMDTVMAREYLYQELYDSTQTKARLISEKNKFKLMGTYKSSSSSEIYLNAMNVPRGSVKVSSGGMPLRENEDYVVDYTLGTVKIINSALMSSGQPIKVSLENNATFNMQTKTLVGSHFNYKISDDFNIGATIMHLNERPMTTKVNIGDEPISNTIWGLNSTYRTNSQFLTTLVDKLPLIQTKETSTITLIGEFAQLIPGSSSAIGKNGVAYIDDFEASETSIDFRSFVGWTLASTPLNSKFPEAKNSNDLSYNYNRAKLSWYTIDNLFYRDNSLTPKAIKNNPEWVQRNNAREILVEEIFRNKYRASSEPSYHPTLDLTYYPTLRGPYNYDIDSLDVNGNFLNPQDRWGGIMKQIYTSDFEAANIEYIEFWLLDPFLEDSTSGNSYGGELYFNLGDLSEDILKDGKMSFEQGLPGPNEPKNYYETLWGRIPATMMLNQAFVNTTGSRSYQDIGLDGLIDTTEVSKYDSIISRLKAMVDAGALSQTAFDKFMADPSSDNFRYYKDPSFDEGDHDVLARYIDYNGMEGNSPEGGAVRSNYSTPDVEDINGDNTLDDRENYYEYQVSIRKGELVKGRNFVVDELSGSTEDNVKYRWLQFKIPLTEFESVVGDIDGFKSIRFVRMYLHGFSKPVTLRFGTLEFVRSEWRKYQGSLTQAGESNTEQPLQSDFDVLSVNVEENSNYDLPPGIDRTVDPNETQYRALNEQSMVLRVEDLSDNDSRAVYKNMNLDMRQYKKLKMFAHVEKLLEEHSLADGDISVFIRIGTDFKNNYYEYEIPLKVSPKGKKDSKIIWPEENWLDLELYKLQKLKQRRNNEGVSFLTVFQEADGKNKISICGNPSLSSIRSIMIGVRNPGDRNNSYRNDRFPKSAEVWVNELRLTDFSDQGGWAANARAQFKLADFGNFRISGSTMQPGFGSIEKKVNDREKVETNQYDLSTDLELGKFFPEKAQVKIPFYASYSQIKIMPQYNPLDPDIPFQAALDNARNKKERDSLEDRSIDQTTRRSISFTNVKVNKSSRNPKPYDPGNFSVSYGYYDQKSSNFRTDHNNLFHHEGSFNYVFNNRPKNIAPFQKSKLFSPAPLRLIRDFNFNYSPNVVSFRTNMTRDTRYTQFRNLSRFNKNPMNENIEHDFNWYRIYEVKYDLSRSIKIDFTAKNNAKIDVWFPKTMGNLDTVRNEEVRENYRVNPWDNIKRFGRTTSYNQQLNITYNIPINKLPLLSWVTANARYGANFEWQFQPSITIKNSIYRLNNINNARSIQLNTNYNLSTIYNQIDFIRDLNNPRGGKQNEKPMKTVRFEKTYANLAAGVPKSISHKLGSEDVTIKVTDGEGNEVKGSMESNSINRLTFTAERDAKNVTVIIEGKVEAGMNPFLIIARNTVRILTGVKSVNISYNQTDGTSLDGYMPKSVILGSHFGKSPVAPGASFILGSQETSQIERMNRNGWLVPDFPASESEFMFTGGLVQSNSKTLNIRINFEPLPGLRIDITGNRSKSENFNSSYMFLGSEPEERYLDRFSDPVESGNFSMSVMAFQSFENLTSDNDYKSKVFDQFLEKREVIKGKLVEQRGPNYIQDVNQNNQEGYSNNSQQVLIPTFLSEYGRYSTSTVELDLFPNYNAIRPNWRASYDGLTEIPFLKEYFQSITLNHSYSATYSIGSYQSNSLYKEGNDGFSYERNETNNGVAGYYVPKFNVTSVSISEQFSPFIGVDMTWKNNLSTRFEYKKSRMVSLGLTNRTINDAHSKEYVFGVGYRFPELPLNMLIPGGSLGNVKSDLDLRADLSIRDDVTVLRMLNQNTQVGEGYTDPANDGDKNITLGLSADYSLSQNLRVRLFFDRVLRDPVTSQSYKTIATKFGFSVQFNLTP